LQLIPVASATKTVKASVNASLRPVNIMIASDNVILAERPALARPPIVHGVGRTFADRARRLLEAFSNIKNEVRS
jgi:hypothetical protein